MNRLEKMKQIVANHQAERMDGMLIDVSSANVYVTIYEALNEKNQKNLESLELFTAMKMVWDLSVR